MQKTPNSSRLMTGRPVKTGRASFFKHSFVFHQSHTASVTNPKVHHPFLAFEDVSIPASCVFLTALELD